jgi:ferric-dicitrate binding protein FerR (iron transport regulator)
VVIGKVAVSSPKQKIILTAQQQVTYDPVSGQLTEHRKAASNIHKEWGKASINFEWASVSEVAKSLEKTFGVEIKFEDPKLKNCYLRADFTNMRLPMILDLLCRSVDAKYTLKDDVIVVSGPGC